MGECASSVDSIAPALKYKNYKDKNEPGYSEEAIIFNEYPFRIEGDKLN